MQTSTSTYIPLTQLHNYAPHTPISIYSFYKKPHIEYKANISISTSPSLPPTRNGSKEATSMTSLGISGILMKPTKPTFIWYNFEPLDGSIGRACLLFRSGLRVPFKAKNWEYQDSVCVE